MPDHHDRNFSRLGLLLLGLVTLGWGLNWPIMKIVLRDVPPLTFRAACLLGGGAGVLLLARLGGQPLAVERRHWHQLLLISATGVIGWNVFVIYGVALVPAGRAALIAYTMPIWAMSLSVWLLNEPLTARRAAALVLGMGGVATMMGVEITELSGSLLGAALLLGAAFSWGSGMVLLKRFAVPIPTVSLTGWTMLIGAVPMALAALTLEQDQWRPVALYPALGVFYNIFVAFMLCYWAWNRIVLMVPVAVSSLASLATPVVGVLAGMLLLSERLTWREVLAAAFILLAIALAVRSPAQPAARLDAATFER